MWACLVCVSCVLEHISTACVVHTSVSMQVLYLCEHTGWGCVNACNTVCIYVIVRVHRYTTHVYVFSCMYVHWCLHTQKPMCGLGMCVCVHTHACVVGMNTVGRGQMCS